MTLSSQGTSLHVAIIGAGGYVGGELLRWLARHPAVGKITACSTSRKGQPVNATHPQLQGRLDLSFVADVDLRETAQVVFYATPVRVAATQAQNHLDAGSLVIDCSPDFRLRDLDTWSKWYGGKHPAPQTATLATYGLVEHERDQLADTRLIAVPGCYATLVQLATIPVVKALAATDCGTITVVANGASGTSGAGRQADRAELLLAAAGNNYRAYALGGHRHVPEMLQGLASHATTTGVNLQFVPHLLPVPRGMFATVHFVTERGDDGLDLTQILRETYAEEAFIDILAAGQSPQLAAVIGSNRCQLGCAEHDLIVMGSLDNLGKGAASQAVQAMNVALDLDEATGLAS